MTGSGMTGQVKVNGVTALHMLQSEEEYSEEAEVDRMVARAGRIMSDVAAADARELKEGISERYVSGEEPSSSKDGNSSTGEMDRLAFLDGRSARAVSCE